MLINTKSASTCWSGPSGPVCSPCSTLPQDSAEKNYNNDDYKSRLFNGENIEKNAVPEHRRVQREGPPPADERGLPPHMAQADSPSQPQF